MAQQLEQHAEALRAAMDDVAASVSLAQFAAHDRLRADMLEADARMDRLHAEMAQVLATFLQRAATA